MYESGTIYADGRIRFDGLVPNKWRLLKLTKDFLIFHSPGQNWSDNGGQHYGAASIHVVEIVELRHGNNEGCWRFRTKRLGRQAQWHPTPSEACRNASAELELRGDDLIAWIDETQKDR